MVRFVKRSIATTATAKKIYESTVKSGHLAQKKPNLKRKNLKRRKMLPH